MQCSPYNNTFLLKHKTCFTMDQLKTIASSIGLKHSSFKTKQPLWVKINEKMLKLDCKDSDEHCWLDVTNNNLNSHVPKRPKSWSSNPYQWLSNIDILNVLIQYEKKYKSFKFFGVFPIDFNEKYGSNQCISKEICNIKLSKLKNYSTFACVFNLDKHNQSGSHWVAVFFDTNKNHTNYGFYYFDSNSQPIPKEILDFGESIKKQVNDKDFIIHQNKVQKQFNNTECGMFCIHFIVNSLKKRKFEELMNDKYYDEDVHKLRKILFR